VPSPLPKFTETVEALERDALGELQGVVRQLDRAVEAVTRPDAQLAGQMLVGEEAAEHRYRLLQQRVLAAMASHRGAPDLQMLASLLHVLRGSRRIAGQCASMARLASTTAAPAREPIALLELVEGAGALSVSGVWLARASFASRDVELAHEVARLDADLARRSRVIQRRAFELADGGELDGRAMTLLLVGSHAERVSDAAVDIAEQTVAIVNGLFREVAEAEPLPGEAAAAR
jgi:phosphate uptake regulator